MSCFLGILGWIFSCVDDEHGSYRPLQTTEPPPPPPPPLYYSPSNHLGLNASSKPPPSSLPSSSKHHAQSSSSSSSASHLSSSSSKPSPTSRPSSNPFASGAPPKATSATLGFSSEASHSESIGPSFRKNEIPKHFEEQIKVSNRLPCVGSVHDQCSSQMSTLLPQTVGSLTPIKISQDSYQVSRGSLPLISSTHDQSLQKSSNEFSGSHSDSCLKTISISQGREKVSKPLPLISPVHDQSANESSELSKPIKMPQMKKPSVNPLSNTKLVSAESSKKSHQVLTESFGITEPAKISQEKQTVSPLSPFGEMIEPLNVSESIKKSNEKDLVVKSSPLTKSFWVPSDEILQNHSAYVHTQKRIDSDENAVVHSLPLLSSIHGQSAQNSPQKFPAKDISDSCLNKHESSSETVGSLKPIKISQYREKVSKSNPLPLDTPVHDESANELSELSEPIKNSQMKKKVVTPFPKTKLVWVESSKKSHQILTHSSGITEPVKISKEKQTISPSPCKEMIEPLHVSESIKKSIVKDLVVKSSPLTKSFWVPSDEILQNHPAHVHTQKRIDSDENAVVHSLPLLSSVHDQSVQKSPQKFSAKDISDSCLNKHESLSETVGSLKPIKISQYWEKVSKSNPLPLDTPVHDQSANELSELSEPIKNSQMKKTADTPFPKTKLVWVESSKKSHQILTHSSEITEPVKISKEKQTISPSPYQEMLEPLHVSESIKKSIVKNLVVKSSLTKSGWLPSDENLQISNTQKCTSSDENVVVHSLPPKKFWVKKSPQQGQIEEREEPSSISLDKKPTAGSSIGLSFCKKYGTDSMEAQVGNEIDEESMQFSRTVRRKKYKLPVYPVPKHLTDLIEKDMVPEVLRKPLSPSTYADYFAALLYAEDFYIEKWTDFILLDVTLELHEEQAKKGSANSMFHSSDDDKKVFIKFEIDSVPERRPFLLSRDFVFLQHSGKKSRTFEGSFCRVMKSTHVLAEFGDDFYSQYSANDRYDVSFSFNRVCLKRCHQAIASAMDPSFRHVVFPDKLCCTDLFVKNTGDYGSIVHKITTMQGGRPYLIHSTHSSVVGEIVTKAVLQIFRKSPSHRILICAPKNRTCDELAASLNEEIPDSELFRANAAFRDIEDVDDFVMPLCAYDGECFITPSLSELEEFRVVTSTYVSSFRLHNCGISAGHFTHIFLVDASSATEPESMIPLANLAGEKTVIVVTGCVLDHPPRVRSDIARRNGLRRSYFHRLLRELFGLEQRLFIDACLNQGSRHAYLLLAG